MIAPTDLDAKSSQRSFKIDLETVRHAIEHAKHYLPSQGPIAVFIHHNTLHAFEHLPFDEAVLEGLRTYGSQPYWPESKYRDEMSRERIQIQDLQAVLSRDIGVAGHEEVALGTTRYELLFQMLRSPVLTGSDSEIRWLFAQSDALDRFQDGVDPKNGFAILDATRHWIMRDLRLHLSEAGSEIPEALRSVIELFSLRTIETWSDTKWQQLTLHLLWQICKNGVQHTKSIKHSPPVIDRHRDVLLRLTRVDCDLLVHDLLIRFASSFLDQGFAGWSIPQRDEGMYRCFLTLLKRSPHGRKFGYVH